MPKINQKNVGVRLEALRGALGETTELDKGPFALSFGLDPSSYSKVILGKKALKSEHAFALAERWGVTMDFLYRGDLSKIDENLRTRIMARLTER